MKIYHCSKVNQCNETNHFVEKPSAWWKLIIDSEAFSYDENSSSLWEFFIVINSDIVIKVYHCTEIILLWWKFSFRCKFITWWIVLLLWKFIIFMKIHWCDENSTVDKSYQFGQNRKFLWKSITVMKIYHCDENSSL